MFHVITRSISSTISWFSSRVYQCTTIGQCTLSSMMNNTLIMCCSRLFWCLRELIYTQFKINLTVIIHCLSFVPRCLTNTFKYKFNKSMECPYPIPKFRSILLKEKNMILTLKYEANQQGFIMLTPERLKMLSCSLYLSVFQS